MSDYTQDLLMSLLATTGRAAFPLLEVFDMVDPTGKSSKQVKSYNLADGTRTQREIIKATKFDPSNFSKLVSKWTEAGIMFRLGTGQGAKLLHVYPLPSKRPKE